MACQLLNDLIRRGVPNKNGTMKGSLAFAGACNQGTIRIRVDGYDLIAVPVKLVHLWPQSVLEKIVFDWRSFVVKLYIKVIFHFF